MTELLTLVIHQFDDLIHTCCCDHYRVGTVPDFLTACITSVSLSTISVALALFSAVSAINVASHNNCSGT